jgi:hypothetical protein
MLWAILFLYLYSHFSSGGGEGLVRDIAKPVKQYVQDEVKAKQIIAINKEMLNEEAAFVKDIVKAEIRLAKLNGNRLASEAEFIEIFAALDQKRAGAREKILYNRFKMKGLMTAEEWSNVYQTAGRQN